MWTNFNTAFYMTLLSAADGEILLLQVAYVSTMHEHGRTRQHCYTHMLRITFEAVRPIFVNVKCVFPAVKSVFPTHISSL